MWNPSTKYQSTDVTDKWKTKNLILRKETPKVQHNQHCIPPVDVILKQPYLLPPSQSPYYLDLPNRHFLRGFYTVCVPPPKPRSNPTYGSFKRIITTQKLCASNLQILWTRTPTHRNEGNNEHAAGKAESLCAPVQEGVLRCAGSGTGPTHKITLAGICVVFVYIPVGVTSNTFCHVTSTPTHILLLRGAERLFAHPV